MENVLIIDYRTPSVSDILKKLRGTDFHVCMLDEHFTEPSKNVRYDLTMHEYEPKPKIKNKPYYRVKERW
jgi:hypothetical protein